MVCKGSPVNRMRAEHGQLLDALAWEPLGARRTPGDDSPPAGDLDARVVAFLCRVLDQRDEATRHEASCPHGRAAARDLGDLDHAAGGRHLDPSAVAGRDDLECLDTLAGVDHGLDTITLHRRHLIVTRIVACVSSHVFRIAVATQHGGKAVEP